MRGFTGGSDGKESTCNAGVRKIPWTRKWQPTPVFLPAESHQQRSPADYSPRGHKEVDKTEWLISTRSVAHQASLPMEFPWQEYWSGLPFPPPETSSRWRAAIIDDCGILVYCYGRKCSISHLPRLLSRLLFCFPFFQTWRIILSLLHRVQFIFLKSQNEYLPDSLSESPFSVFQSLSHSPNTFS